MHLPTALAAMMLSLLLTLTMAPLPARGQPANASLAVWLAEGETGATLAAQLRVLAADPPPEIAARPNGQKIFARLVSAYLPLDAILEEAAAAMERRLEPETLATVQRFDASIFGVRLATRRVAVADALQRRADVVALQREGRRLLAEADDDRRRSYRVYVPARQDLALIAAMDAAFEHALWAPLRAAGFFGAAEAPAAYRERLAAEGPARQRDLAQRIAARNAAILAPFSDGLVRWSAEQAAGPEGRAYSRTLRRALAGAILPRAHALGRALALRFGTRGG